MSLNRDNPRKVIKNKYERIEYYANKIKVFDLKQNKLIGEY